MLYAIVDIETTGGHAASNGITEIALYVYDGETIVNQYETLVNPFRSIPPYVQALTGITDEMVQLAPAFAEIAPRVFELLQGKVFVAHNVNFDYSFLLHAFRQEGYALQCPKLCTVRYARKLSPGLSSYSLGNLCRHFGINVKNRHRAGGDAHATVQLFHLLKGKDVNNHLFTMLRKQSGEQYLPVNLDSDTLSLLPETPGVYYFHDSKDKVIYVGKAKALRKRVSSYFSNNNPGRQRQEFLRNIHRVSYKPCGTELMAQILETIEIKRLWPRFNRAMKGYEAKYALYLFEDSRGYLRLAIDRKKKNFPALHSFAYQYEGMQLLRRLISTHALCEKLCFVDRSADERCGHTACKGACAAEETPEGYNRRVREAIDSLQEELGSFLIRQRAVHEPKDCCILIENGKFFGMGYAETKEQYSTTEAWKGKVQPYPEYDFIRNLLYRYAAEHPETVTMLS